MSDVYSAKPADSYDDLKKQFSSALLLAKSLESQLKHYRNKDYSLAEKRLESLEAALESERDMNAIITNENQQLQTQLDAANTRVAELESQLGGDRKSQPKKIKVRGM